MAFNGSVATATAGAGPSSPLGYLMNSGMARAKGNPRAATDWMRRALTQIDFSTRDAIRREGGWLIYIEDCLSFGWASVDIASEIIVFGSDTWAALQCATKVYERVVNDLRASSSGLKMLNAETIQQLMRVQELGIDRDDEITRLEKLAEQLMLEASSINAKRNGVSPHEISEYALRSGQLQEGYTNLNARLSNLGALVEATTDAVRDVLSLPVEP